MKPAQDKTLQAAIKQKRVMTVFQETVGAKADFGKVGFEEGSSRQYLIFPKPVRAFEGRKVVGIKYDLLSAAEVPKSKRARPAKPPRKASPKKPKSRPPKGESTRSKVIEFPGAEREKPEKETDLREIKRLARQAMQALEKGKQIAAFNFLKRIAGA